ncbi:hypothetical protein BSLG_001217 [Batrachochytrium salamandrivorans]|nr:hypothetical protein BSLG_001217 [Batrachochytrium salamandrivorans]
MPDQALQVLAKQLQPQLQQLQQQLQQQQQQHPNPPSWKPLSSSPPIFAIVRSLFVPPAAYLAEPNAKPYLHRLEVGDYIQLLEVNAAWYRGILYPSPRSIAPTIDVCTGPDNSPISSAEPLTSTNNGGLQHVAPAMTVRPCIVPIDFVALVVPNKLLTVTNSSHSASAHIPDGDTAASHARPDTAVHITTASTAEKEEESVVETVVETVVDTGPSSRDAHSPPAVASLTRDDRAADTTPSIPNAASQDTLNTSIAPNQLSIQTSQVSSHHHPPLLVPPYDSLAGVDDPFLDDVAATLREWCVHINSLVIEENYALYPAISNMFRFVSHTRQTLRSHHLSASEIELYRRRIIYQIYLGNSLLNLDTVLFDPVSGALLSDRVLSIIDLHACYNHDNSKPSSSRHQSLEDLHLPGSGVSPLLVQGPVVSQPIPFTRNYSLPALSNSLLSTKKPSSGDFEPLMSSNSHLYMEYKGSTAPFCELGEMVEMFFFIYDATEGKTISEEYLVRLNSNGTPSEERSSLDSTQSSKLATLFSDLSSKDLNNSLMLVCRIVHIRIANVSNNESAFDRALKSGVAVAINVREKLSSIGIAAMAISDLLKNKSDSSAVPKPFAMRIVLPVSAESDSMHLDNLLSQPELLQSYPHMQAMQIELAVLDSDSPIYVKRSGILEDTFPSCRLNHFGSAGPPIMGHSVGDHRAGVDIASDYLGHSLDPSKNRLKARKRNSLFLTLEEGMFAGVRLSGGRAVQVSVKARSANGDVIRNSFFAGTGEQPTDHFDSIVYAGTASPKWSETLRVDIELSAFKNAHLFFTFRVCTPATGEMAAERFAFAFLPLIKSRYAAITDTVHHLTLYKFDTQLAVPSIYLNYAAGPTIFVPTHLSLSSEDSLTAAADAIAKLPVLKDTFSVSTFLFSTVMTQDSALLNLLNWRQHIAENGGSITQILTDFELIDEMEVVKFMPPILTELMSIIGATLDSKLSYFFPSGNASSIQRYVFEKLVFVLTIATSRRFVKHIDLLGSFFQVNVEGSRVWPIICEQLEQLLRSGAEVKHGKLLRSTIKVIHHITMLIIYSAAEFVPDPTKPERVSSHPHVISVSDTCLARIQALHDGIQYLVSLSHPDHALASQALALQHFSNFAITTSRVFDNARMEKCIASFLMSINTGKPKLKSGRILLLRTMLDRPEFSSHLGKLRKLAAEIVLDALSSSPWVEPIDSMTPPLKEDAVFGQGFPPSSSSFTETVLNLNGLDTEVVVQAISLFKALLRHIQPILHKTKNPGIHQESGLQTDRDIDERRILVIKKEIGKHVWSRIMYAMVTSFLSFYNQSRLVQRDQNKSESEMFVEKDTVTSDSFSQEHKTLCNFGAVVLSFFDLFSIEEIYDLLQCHTLTLGVISTAQLLTQLTQCFRILLQPDVFDRSWLTLNVTVIKTNLTILQIVLSSLCTLYTHIPRDPPMVVKSTLEVGNSEATLGGTEYLADNAPPEMSHSDNLNPRLDGHTDFKTRYGGPLRSRVVQKLDGDIRTDASKLLVDAWSLFNRLISTEQRLLVMPRGFIGLHIDLTFRDHAIMRNATVDVLYGVLKTRFLAEGGFKKIEGDCFDYLHAAIENGDICDFRAGGPFVPNELTHKKEKSQNGADYDSGSLRQTRSQQQSVELFFVAALESRLATEEHSTFVFLARAFLRAINKFVKIIVSHRQLPLNEVDERISSTIRVLRFLKTARRRSFFIKYLHSLFDIHISEGSLVEAAITLKHHADLLNWRNDTTVEPVSVCGFPTWQTEFDCKEQIILHSIQLFSRGQAFERAAELCTLLADEYRYRIWDYANLSSILRFQSKLYDKIASEERCYPSYYRVIFYGNGFSRRITGKQYIYRGEEWEKLSAFCERIQVDYPNSKIISKSGPVGSEIEDSDGRYLQITAVSPVADTRLWEVVPDHTAGMAVHSNGYSGMFGTIGWELEAKSVASTLLKGDKHGHQASETNHNTAGGLPLWLFVPELFVDEPEAKEIIERQNRIPSHLRSYYEHNEVSMFAFSRPIRRIEVSDPTHHPAQEFLELWTEKTILLSEDVFPCMSRRSRVCQVMTFEISPIENAIVAVRSKTKQLLGFEAQFKTLLGSYSTPDASKHSELPILSRMSADSYISNQSRGVRISSSTIPLTSGGVGVSGVSNSATEVRATTENDTYNPIGSVSSATPLPSVNPFTMALNGAVDAPVNGGIPMYKSAFLTAPFLGASYNSSPCRDVLNKAILEHVEVIHHCLAVHNQVVPIQMRPLHDEIVKMFHKNYASEIAQIGLGTHSNLPMPASQNTASQSKPYLTRSSNSGPFIPGRPTVGASIDTASRRILKSSHSMSGDVALSSAGTVFDLDATLLPSSAGLTSLPTPGLKNLRKLSIPQSFSYQIGTAPNSGMGIQTGRHTIHNRHRSLGSVGGVSAGYTPGSFSSAGILYRGIESATSSGFPHSTYILDTTLHPQKASRDNRKQPWSFGNAFSMETPLKQ